LEERIGNTPYWNFPHLLGGLHKRKCPLSEKVLGICGIWCPPKGSDSGKTPGLGHRGQFTRKRANATLDHKGAVCLHKEVLQRAHTLHQGGTPRRKHGFSPQRGFTTPLRILGRESHFGAHHKGRYNRGSKTRHTLVVVIKKRPLG